MESSFAIHYRNKCRNQGKGSQCINLDTARKETKSREIIRKPENNHAVSRPSFIPKAPHPVRNPPVRAYRRSSPIRINKKDSTEKERFNRNKSASFTETWAGPTYHYSPPPSSLPMPTFSMKPVASPDKSISPATVLADPMKPGASPDKSISPTTLLAVPMKPGASPDKSISPTTLLADPMKPEASPDKSISPTTVLADPMKPDKSISPTSVLADPTEVLRSLLNLDIETDVV